MSLDPVLARIDADLDQSVARLFDLLKIPSISTDPAYAGDVRRAGQWCVDQLSGIGFEASLRDTPGHPMVVAHWRGQTARPGPSLLFYGHYDVQPVDPLELWEAPPFEPRLITRPDGSKMIGARGSSDDKGQLMTFIEAMRAYVAVTGGLPCPMTVFLEGEEESGSPSLPAYLDANRAELARDFAFVCDTDMIDPRTPTITASLRGLVGEEVTITCADYDLHSGMYGGAAANPIRVLAKILAGLHDETGRVTLPGFYDGVDEVPAEIKAAWAQLDRSAEKVLGPVGLAIPSGEQGRSIAELIWARPTCEFNGITGGYTGEGFKTVLPAKASVKVSFRLVGRQDPDKIRAAFRAFVSERLPKDAKVAFKKHGGSPGLAQPYDSPNLRKAADALTAEWGVRTQVVGSGGSIPVVGEFKKRLGMDTLLIGYALADDRIHSPNEKYDLTSFHKGIRSWARVMAAM